MEATRELVRVTGKPLKWTLVAVRIAGWLLWLSSILLLAVAGILIFVALNVKGMWFMLVVLTAVFSGIGSFLSCYGYTQLLTFRALIQRLKGGLDQVERVVEHSGESLEEIRRIRDGIRGKVPPPPEAKTAAETQV